MQDFGDGKIVDFDSDASDPCNGLILRKFRPNEDGQSVEVEHFGPDGATLQFILVELKYRSRLRCQVPQGAIDLLGGIGTRVKLTCNSRVQLP